MIGVLRKLLILMAWMLPVGCEPSRPPLELREVEPTGAPSDRAVPLVISGNFYAPVQVDLMTGRQTLDMGFDAWLDDLPLEEVELLSSSELSAVVPAGVPRGLHDVRVRDPLGREAVLEDSFEIGPPDLSRPVVTFTSPEPGTRLLPGESVDVAYAITDRPPGVITHVEWRVFGALTLRGERDLSDPASEYYSSLNIPVPESPTRHQIVVVVAARDDAPTPNTGLGRIDLRIDECQIDAECDDGLYCDGRERCIEGHCVAGLAPDCDDGLYCTVDSCEEETRSCVHEPDDGRCDDGLFCNGVETCSSSFGCVSGTPPCDDGIECTVDFCDEEPSDEGSDRCSHVPDDRRCDDGVFCNGFEVCSPEYGCLGGQDPCADDLECTETLCVESRRTCAVELDDEVCDDGDPCTIDRCDKDLGCVHEPAREEPTLSGVCNDGIDNDCDGLVDGSDPDCRPDG